MFDHVPYRPICMTAYLSGITHIHSTFCNDVDFVVDFHSPILFAFVSYCYCSSPDQNPFLHRRFPSSNSMNPNSTMNYSNRRTMNRTQFPNALRHPPDRRWPPIPAYALSILYTIFEIVLVYL